MELLNPPHIAVCSESGTRKSTFAATLIQTRNTQPVLVQLFDAPGKGTPYRRRAKRIERVPSSKDWPWCEREMLWVDDKLVAVMEHWHEHQGISSPGIPGVDGRLPINQYVRQGEKWYQYEERMRDFTAEVADGNWSGYIHDSATSATLAVESYLVGKVKISDRRQLSLQSKSVLSRWYLNCFPTLTIPTILVAHVAAPFTEDGNANINTGMKVRLPGQLGYDLFAHWDEVYRSYLVKDPTTKENVQYMQTERDDVWSCSSQLQIPNPFGPNPHWRTVFEAARAIGGGEGGDNGGNSDS